MDSHEIQPSIPQSTDQNLTTDTGEKRKREDDGDAAAIAPQPEPTSEPSLHPSHKTSLCPYFRRFGGSCSHGSECRYAHGEEELRQRPDNTWDPTSEPSLHPYHKTSLCSYFRRFGGSCSHGSECRYAHGEEELRQRPDKTWDPTSERAKKAIKLDESNGDDDEGEGTEEVDEHELQIMMTDSIDDDDGDGEGNGGCFDARLSKCLVHLPKRWISDDLKKFLTDQGIIFKSAKKKRGMAVGFVGFDSAELVESATKELDGKRVGNQNLKVADVVPRPFDEKIKSAMASAHNNTMGSSLMEENASGDTNSKSSVKCARDVVTPLAHMPYHDQIEQKKNSIKQMLKKLTKNARKACPNGVSFPEWVMKSRELGFLPCKLEGVLESPLRNGYRNKCEFSVGYSLQGKPTVGFTLGNFREGVTAVEEPVDCPNVSNIARKYALIFQDFLQQSGLPIWNRFKNTGFWRQLTVREGRTPGKVANVENPEENISEVMLMVQVCSVGIDEGVINSEFERMAHTFVTRAAENAPSLPLTVLVIQDHQGISNVCSADAPLRILPLSNEAGDSKVEVTSSIVEARIHDHIGNLRFSISPTAFFQVNTLAAEKLYALAGDWADLNKDTLLFDVCCGTGTIGLTLAHRVGMVVGIERNSSAVSDAHRNAQSNGIKNCRFVCAKAEDVMGSLLKEYLNPPQQLEQLPVASDSDNKVVITAEENGISKDSVVDTNENSSHQIGNQEGASGSSENGGQEVQNEQMKNGTSEDGTPLLPQFKNVVAIIDPPRNGLHPTVIKALRTHPLLRRLVYISCNPETLVANAIELCTPSSDNLEKGNKNNRAWRKMSSAGLARHRTKSMPYSEPFRPIKAMAVDLFPHTTHCEMVMLLERS